jgi:hypothetical protein
MLFGRLGGTSACVVLALSLAALAGFASGCSKSKALERHTGTGRQAERPPRVPVVDPYKAAFAFASCMRQHGVPHPDPDRGGNFRLTPHDEQLMRRAGPRKRDAAEKACFHYLKPVVSTKPLSPHAKTLAKAALQGFSRCMRAYGYDFFRNPVVRNRSLGRAFFGFEKADPRAKKVQRSERYLRARNACEKKLNAKLDDIVANDRGEIPY